MGLKDLLQQKKIMDTDGTAYLSLKEERRIAQKNAKTMRTFERRKNRKNVSEAEYLTQMEDAGNVVEFSDVHTYFFTDIGTVKAVNGVSFAIPQGKTVGIVGESGCGKSVTSLSLMQLVQAPQGQVVSGEIRYTSSEGKCYNIVNMPRDKMLHIRGREISMIFQEPMTSLNPVFTIGDQMDEVVLLHEENMTAASAKARSLKMLDMVGIAMPDKIHASYPHELSGGMRQRVMIAMALSCSPRLVIADEPTTALDVTIQAQILSLLKDIKHKINGSIMLITHDLGVIAEMADYVVVMYAGRIVEKGTAEDVFYRPKHPYTAGLMRSKPSMSNKLERLYSIPGQVPSPINMPNHCYFANRCEHCMERCFEQYPPLMQFSDTHFASCYLYGNSTEPITLPLNVEKE